MPLIICEIALIGRDNFNISPILQSRGYNVTFVVNGNDLLMLLRRKSDISLVIMDSILPDYNFLNLITQIRNLSKLKYIPIIVLSQFNDNKPESLDVGADDYITRPFEIMELLARVKAILRRAEWQNNHFTRFINEQEKLTVRQVEILNLTSHGYSNKQIADELFVSEKTIKAHFRTIFEKLQVNNRTQAVVVAYREGLAS